MKLPLNTLALIAGMLASAAAFAQAPAAAPSGSTGLCKVRAVPATPGCRSFDGRLNRARQRDVAGWSRGVRGEQCDARNSIVKPRE